MYYQVQYVWFEKKVESYDPRFKNRLNEINYVGKFNIEKADLMYPQQAPGFTLASTTVDGNGVVSTERYSDKINR